MQFRLDYHDAVQLKSMQRERRPMHTSIQEALDFAIEGNDVPADVAHDAVSALMDGECGDVEIAALLTALRTKGESVDEIFGAARAMREHAAPIATQSSDLLDTCGTGGDQLHTFNISTATALVAAAAGVTVAKHGNRSVSSSSGSADVLEAMGINVQLPPEAVGRCVDQIGIGFCFAPLFHGAMKYAAPIRKQLGFRTIFNLLGPLTNPADAQFQLLGASRTDTAEKLAHASCRLGRKHVLVVCGDDSIDEVCLWGPTQVFEVIDADVRQMTWTAESFGLPSCTVDELKVSSAAESADVIQRVFGGEQGARRNIVLANAAAALMAANRCSDAKSGVEIAASAIDSGKAEELCARLAKFSNSAS